MNKYENAMNRIGFYYIRGEEGCATTSEAVLNLEQAIGFPLPEDYKIFLMKYGLTAGRGLVRFGNLDDPTQPESTIGVFYGIRAGDSYDILSTKQGFDDDLPAEMLPIASSPGGQIVLCLAGENVGKVYWWPPHGGGNSAYEDLELIAYDVDRFVDSLRTCAE